MTDGGNILLLADDTRAAGIAERVGGEGVWTVSEPYDALLEMGKSHWSAVLLTAPRPDFAGLCRAARRLQKSGRLYGLCPPSAEPDVRPLRGGALDDYFILPLSARDAGHLRQLREQTGTTSQPEQGGGALSADEISELLRSAKNVESLEQWLADFVARLIGAEVYWRDGAADEEDTLLEIDGERRRVLVADGARPAPDAAVRTKLAELAELMPAVTATARRAEALHRLAITDHLTGAYNRRYFYHLTDRILAQADGSDFRVTLLLWDIDDFKRYNDTYGYAAGDEILRETVQLIKRITRSHDIVARIGGDEFAVLFWDPEPPRRPDSHPIETPHALANRFRQAVANHSFRRLGPEQRGSLTISGGLAKFPRDGRTCRELLAAADRALKQGKFSGKNAIHLIGG
ncbi:MAG: GGDEF domain-containing protein [Phycisphaerae bacterium]